MARVTVEDCVEVVANRFELVAVAGQRAKDIASGAPLTIERDNDKNAVVALREIADKKVDVPSLRELLIKGKQKRVKLDSFGVEETGVENLTIISEEVAEEMGSLQGESSSSFSDEDEDFSYSYDDVDSKD